MYCMNLLVVVSEYCSDIVVVVVAFEWIQQTKWMVEKMNYSSYVLFLQKKEREKMNKKRNELDMMPVMNNKSMCFYLFN